MTIDHDVKCVTASIMSSALERGTECEETDIVGERSQDSNSSNSTRSNSHGDSKVLANHDFWYGNDGGFNREWPMLRQDANNPRSNDSFRNSSSSSNNTGYGTREEHLGLAWATSGL
ncbi:hypothetical protein Hdeb2414_s0008g00281961 [Helianthus debilis subsp. tardiflorus]